MKKFIPFLSIAIVMAACNSAPDKDLMAGTQNMVQPAAQAPLPDTVGLAKYQAWKATNELADVQQYEKPVAQVRTITRTVKVPAKHVSSPAKTTAPAQPQVSNSGDGGSGSMTSESGQTAQAEQKKGWSKAAKGAVIGGVGGAAAGAVINKQNRVVGAVIGAVLGAGGGYAIGRGMDKKDGRIELK